MSPTGSTETSLRPPTPRWERPSRPDPARLAELVAALKLPAAVCSILAVRGFDVDAAKRFLRPRLDMLADPKLLADGEVAAARIARAVRDEETIFVHGDYDVDGICATTLYTRWLRALGGRVTPFVPHRIRDGYDFSASGLGAALEAGASLVVTADCATVAHGTIAEAKARGLDVVVTDHHTVGSTLPPADAVVNPQRSDCAYPDKGLCGTGVALRVCALVADALDADPDGLTGYLDLVALATVADLVPLVGENRILVHYGLRRFADTKVTGLRSLLGVSDVDASSVTTGQLGFRVAPRINAAGRIGDAAQALRLLLTDDPAETDQLAGELDTLNSARRDEDQRTLDEALEMLAATFDPERDFGVVLAGEGWHPGVIGIVASRVVERIHRPVVMIALGEGLGRGSARSVPGFHLYDALLACSSHLERFGGHRQAAGMDVRPDAIDAFRSAFNAVARSVLAPEDLSPRLRPEIDVELGEVDAQLVHWLSYLGPHGIGNPTPLLRARGVSLADARVVGSGHLKARLRQGGASLDAIGFGLADRVAHERIGAGSCDVLFKAERNEWRGEVRPQAKLVDVRPAEGSS